jgi:hypothetical protein
MNVPPPAAPTRRREAVVGAAIAVVVAVLIAVVGLVGGSDDGRSAGAAAPTPTTPTAGPEDGGPPSVPTAPEATGPTGPADVLPVALPAVALDEQASGEDGISARVVSLEAIDGTAHGPGNIAGPALRATVRLTNGTSDAVDLDLVGVTLAHGKEATPSSPLDAPSRAPFTGTLAPGDRAEGVYVFTVPEDARDVVTLTVGYRAGAPFLVFTGSAD